jgi:hypothetical protein
MGIRDRLRRIEADHQLERFQLADGGWYSYDRATAGPKLFLHVTDCLCAHDNPEWPEPPPLLKAMARAKHRRAVLDHFFREGFLMFPYDVEAFYERGEFIRRSMVVDSSGRHYEPGEPIPFSGEDYPNDV